MLNTDDVKNLDIHVEKGVISTIEIFNAENLNLHLSLARHASRSGDTDTERQQKDEEKTAYGTVSLDPSLENVSVTYDSPAIVGSVILTRPTKRDHVAKGIILKIQDGAELVVAEPNGSTPRIRALKQDSEQYHAYHDGQDWQIKALIRHEKDYPSLAHSTTA